MTIKITAPRVALSFKRPGCARLRTVAALLALWPAAGDVLAERPAAVNELKWDWSARVQVDHGRFSGVYTRSGAAADATYLRRAELGGEVRWREQWRAAAAVELDSEYEHAVPEAFIGWRPRAELELRAGRIDPDFGLEPSTSTNWTYGIERSPIWDLASDVADANGGVGVRADAHGPRWAGSAGVYDKRDHRAATARAVWMSRPGRGHVLQLGASLAHALGRADDGRLRTRLAVRGVTEDEAGRRSTLAEAVDPPQRYTEDRTAGVEFAWQGGPVMLQAELLSRRLFGRGGAADRHARGTTLLVAWSPTGTARRHDERRARFGRPDAVGRLGHVELFVRADSLAVRGGGDAQVTTLGVSWIAGRIWRGSINLHRARSDDANPAGDRSGGAVTARVQAVF
ncbi:MAG: hypothetical protein KIT17_22725 [Rubrivivax sp.]|nr:hypothetical protein [Rubrivivax sp.]